MSDKNTYTEEEYQAYIVEQLEDLVAKLKIKGCKAVYYSYEVDTDTFSLDGHSTSRRMTPGRRVQINYLDFSNG